MGVSKPVMIVAIVIVVLIVGFIGFKTLAPKKAPGGDQQPPPEMMQNMPGTGAQGSAPAQPTGGAPSR